TLELVAQSKPDGIIVNLDADPAKGLPLIDRVVERYPRCALLVYSSHPELLVEAHRHGAKSLLVHPVQLEDLSQALRNLAAGLSLHRPTKGKIIAVMSSRGEWAAPAWRSTSAAPSRPTRSSNRC